VLGREFGYELIEPVAQRPEPELQAALDQLVDAGLLFCRGTPPHASYLFKHALVQDAAYSTLLRGRRQELHGRVAAALEAHFAGLVERQPELLAHHLTAAGNTEHAVEQWLKAGQHAAARLAYIEAIAHFERGLAVLASLPESPARDGQEIELQLARGVSLFTIEGLTSPAADQAYKRAQKLSERHGTERQRFMAVYGVWQQNADRILDARGLSEKLLQMTEHEEDGGLRLQAHHSGWTTGFYAGEPAAALAHCEAGRQLYDPERHRSHRFLFGGHDPGVCAWNMAGQLEWALGFPDKALASSAEALALAQRLAHPFSLEHALIWKGLLHVYRGEAELALRQLDVAEALVAEQRLGFVFEPRFLRGAALIAQGATEEAIACLREGLAHEPRARSYGLAALARALVERGEHAAAFATISQAFETMEATGQRQWNSELHRLKGLVFLAQNDLEESQRAFTKALRVARRRQMKAYELRAATSLARLWGERGRRAEASDLLAPVYGWFTEGFDTVDLKEAKALLDELT
jgi:tetratricopeptide (TPR) repeat protein